MNLKHALIATLMGAACLLIAAGCNTLRGSAAQKDYNADPLTVAVPSNVSPGQVQNAMTRALTDRDWAVVSSSPNEVVGELNHRGFRAKAMLEYNGSQIRILSDSTYYVQNRDEWQPAVPYGWLENLQKDLRRHVSEATY